MSEWWTYSLSDFLLFSPRTYYRLFALYNEALWPAHIATAALGGLCLTLARRGGDLGTRAVLIVLATLWFWIAWAFHAERFTTINWAAIYYACAFALQAALLLWFALVTPPPTARSHAPLALGIAIFAVFLQPAIGPLLGRDWHQAEVFGLAPDPTAVATLALLAMQPRAPRLLLIIPTLWCVMTGLTLWTMQPPDALITPVAGALALLAAAWKTPRHEAR
ncbi:MAG: hypothetical protein JNK07_06010 [Alphaproteobacteria bacterium]|nr:hypothetical protein [Alphaproteobacteria bacterium]